MNIQAYIQKRTPFRYFSSVTTLHIGTIKRYKEEKVMKRNKDRFKC